MSRILSPPSTFAGRLKYLGPGFILSAAIVGSGELIATTALGAKAGFVTFWVIIVSCLVKVALQLEFGKNAIYTGTFMMHNFNQLPGRKWGRAHWSIWLWLSLQGLKLLQVGGIVGGVAIVLNMAWPSISVNVWAILSVLITSFLVYRGHYGPIEKGALVMIILFTGVILVSLILLQGTKYAIHWEQIKSGLQFSLPTSLVAIAFGAFGITGVGGDEIMYYNYWCIEKGYAAYTGPNDGTPEWAERAKGWFNVMYLDAVLSMVVYTVVTAAFYLLGAAVLHRGGAVPEGYEMIEVLSRIFTETLGPWAKNLFLVGAFFVLYSTLFTATASWARVWGDAFGELGWMKFDTAENQRKSIAILSWILPAAWCVLYLFIQSPVLMVILGGIATSILLLLIVYVSLVFRFKELPASLKPTLIYDIFFWISVVSILMVSAYGVIKII
ncbi:Nramp family divalent metal transporter [Dyadobacter sp. CY107]|uniref:Nramp family divalent metal transporter n=1 Tax=Dyadobacter fanqingshengii TaxID=2906443 RepID=UPI001F2ADA8F|nr:Nramp family divalent metal transporter [Dyadobacter fanqingshengii]MCF2503846.1 Nramp family divalent metal transporter [Dyadobacter fanqingshengii]